MGDNTTTLLGRRGLIRAGISLQGLPRSSTGSQKKFFVSGYVACFSFALL